MNRVAPLARVISACAPDTVLLQEATRPAVIEQLDSTTLLFPGDRATVDPYLNLVVDIAA